MATQDTLHALVKIVAGEGWTPEQVAGFKERWNELGPEDVGICPGCFADTGEAAALEAKPAHGGTQALVCSECGEAYETPSK